MRIHIITMAFPAPSEAFVLLEVEALRRLGHDIVVWTLYGKWFGRRIGPVPPSDRAAGIMTNRATLGGLVGGVWQLLRRPSITLAVLQQVRTWTRSRPSHRLVSLAVLPRAMEIALGLKAGDPDVVHLYWGHYTVLVAELMAGLGAKVPFSTSLSAHDLLAGYGGSVPIANRSGFLRTWASANRTDLIERGVHPSRIRVVHQGIDAGKMARASNHEIRVHGALLTASRLVAEKNVEGVLEVLVRLIEAPLPQPVTHLSICGDGPELPRLRHRTSALGLEHCVTFRGHLSQDALYAEMGRSNVFLYPSMYAADRLPNVIKEAMLAGCVCIVSPTVGVEELVQEGVTGFIRDPADIDGIATLVADIMARPWTYDHVRICAREHIARYFDVDHVARTLTQEWTSMRYAGSQPQ